MTKHDAVIFIGRFQPFHNAHAQILNKAFSIGEHVFIVIGSSYRSRTYKNPFTAIERHRVIKKYLENRNISENRYSFINSEDYLTDDEWADQIFNSIPSKYHYYQKSMAIIGHTKDSSSYYLQLFPTWNVVEVKSLENGMSATDIRDVYFNPKLKVNFQVPQETTDFLEEFRNTSHFQELVQERKKLEEYQKPYINLPFPPTFVTADAVVCAKGKFLLITRKYSPGKGLFALPGGFLDADKDPSVQSAMVRELREETGIVLGENAIKDFKIFDSPSRSSRGRTITHAFYSILDEVPDTTATDDAESVHWLDWSVIYDMRDRFFEDHYLIIKYFYYSHFYNRPPSS